jgi:TonB family protein
VTHKMISAIFILLTILNGAAQERTQTNQVVQPTAPAPSPQLNQKIVTKDPDYLKLLNPPQGNVFLQTYSQSYRDKSTQIEAKVAAISDDNLRSQTANEEWVTAHKNDGDKFTYEAEVALREAKLSFSQRHRDGWFEVGRVNYDENNGILAVIQNSTTPIDAALRIPMKVAVLNQLYGKFHEIAGQEIDLKVKEYVAKAGEGSNCSRNSDWCYKYAKEDIEQRERSNRMKVVAQGDMESMRIDRLLLVDYDTEAVLLDLNAPSSTLSSATWRFTLGPVPTAPMAHASTGTREHTLDGGTSGASSPTVSQNTSSSAAPANPVSVPANVVAASVVTKVNPEYPAEARAKNIQGEVLLHATIDKAGNMSQVQVWSGDDALAKSAVEAVRQWKYKPMLVDSEPKEVDTTITVTFSMKD